MKIGEKYRVALESMSMTMDKNRRPQKKMVVGEVVHVHPKGRFATLRFQGVHGPFREAFRLEQLTESNRVRKMEG